MKQVKVTDFRANLPKYLAMATAGDTVMVLSRGRPIACLVPAAGASKNARGKLADLRKRARIGDVVSPLGMTWVVTRACS